MEQGRTVRVTEFGGRQSIRRVVADRGRLVLVCNDSEWEEAIREQRGPQGIGFPRENVVEVEAGHAQE